MFKKIKDWNHRHPVLLWLLVRYIALFVIAYMFYYTVYWIMLQLGLISWERFANVWAELIPYTQAILIGVILISNTLDIHITRLIEGIHKTAQGNFHHYIDTKKSGPFSGIYEEFNLMSKELSQVQNLRDDFTNQFSHEFKTPITSIQGFAKLLKNPTLSEEQRLLYLDTIEKEASRLADLSTNVMVLTALEGQEIIPDKVDFDLAEHIRQAVILAYPNAEKKQIQLEMELDDELMYHGSPDLLIHVWNNLLGNAIKFTEEKGHIWVKAWKDDEHIYIRFTNDGPLIPEDKLAYLFEKFYQEDNSGTKEGLGLGLAITKRVLALSNGSITVESSPALKTRFTAVL